jgi:hypothetical protein
MTDLNENAPFDEVLEGSNTDTQEQSDIETVSESDAEIDAINEALTEAEADPTVAENTTVEPVNNSDRLPDELSGNPEQLEEPSEPEPNPWDDAPKDVYFYDKTYEDGHLGSYTESAEMAYKLGWYENRIAKDDVKQSDINGWTYVKDKCPMKTADDISRDEAKARIFELKNFLTATDYKAIKYAEGALTADEYEPDRQARADARAEINRLEASL